MKKKHALHLTFDAEYLAVPEVHVTEGENETAGQAKQQSNPSKSKKLDVKYDNLALPEVIMEDDG